MKRIFGGLKVRIKTSLGILSDILIVLPTKDRYNLDVVLISYTQMQEYSYPCRVGTLPHLKGWLTSFKGISPLGV